MDYKRNWDARRNVAKLLEECQQSEAEFANQVQLAVKESNECLAQILAQWFTSYTPNHPVAPEEAKKFRAFTSVSFERWIDLQCQITNQSTSLPSPNVENMKNSMGQRAFKPLGDLMEAVSTKWVDKQKRDEILKEMGSLCTQFVNEALDHLDTVKQWHVIGAEINGVSDRLGVKLERLYSDQQKKEVEALNTMQRHLNNIRRSYPQEPTR